MVSETDVAGRRPDQRAHRLAKLEALHARGGAAYPYRYPTDSSAAAVRPTVARAAAHITATRNVTSADGTLAAHVVASASRSVSNHLTATAPRPRAR